MKIPIRDVTRLTVVPMKKSDIVNVIFRLEISKY